MKTRYTLPITVGALGDFQTEWWTDEDWTNYRKELERLRETGELGKTYDIDLIMEHWPMLDEVKYPDLPEATSSMYWITIDYGKTE